MTNFEQTRNVLIAVDAQNDFITGSLAVNGGEQVVPPINDLATTVRESGGQVVFTRDWHPAQTPHFNVWPVHCIADTEGAAFHPDLDVRSEDIVISKGMGQTHGYSGMEGVGPDRETLEAIVAPRSPRETVCALLAGLATDYCVKATAIDLAQRFADDERVAVYLVRDAVRAVNLQPTDEQAALEAMAAAGVVALSTAQIKARFFAAEGVKL